MQNLFTKLKDVRKVKQKYFLLQRSFYSELTDRFPHLMKSDMAKTTNKLEEELHLMLCCSLKYRSIKIPLAAKPRYSYDNNKTIVNVQRGEPGFYYPRSERGTTDIHYMNLQQYITDKGDMHIGYKNSDKKEIDEMLVKLSDLKKQKTRIYADKMNVYFSLLKEIMAYRPKFLCYVSEGYRRGIGVTFKESGLDFHLMPRSMDVVAMSEEKKGKHYDPDDDEIEDVRQEYQREDDDEYEQQPAYAYSSSSSFRYSESKSDIFRLLDYSADEKYFDKNVHYRLKLFIGGYPKIEEHLIREEAKKKKAYETCQQFLDQLRVHTVPFKVLGEITGK